MFVLQCIFTFANFLCIESAPKTASKYNINVGTELCFNFVIMFMFMGMFVSIRVKKINKQHKFLKIFPPVFEVE